MNRNFKYSALLLGAFWSLSALAAPPPVTLEELWELYQQQQKELQELKKRLDYTYEDVEELEKKSEEVDLKLKYTYDEVEELEQKTEAIDRKADAAVEAAETLASRESHLDGAWAARTQVHGYGSMHYNNLNADDSNNDVDEIDFHRFILEFEHQFSSRLRFASELEFEHAQLVDKTCTVEKDPNLPPSEFVRFEEIDCPDNDIGEFELEQAYIEYDINDTLSTQGGIFIIPAGIVNLYHKPTSFYGVERNDVESILIPTTWWAGGVNLQGRHDNGISWDVSVHEGLKMSTQTLQIRGGRQKTSAADANNLAYTARVKYTGVPGLEWAATFQHQTDASQEGGDGLGRGNMYTTHVIYNRGPFGLRALYVFWDFDVNKSKINAAAFDGDEQWGWYVEPSYKPLANVGLYTRYEEVEGARSQDQFDQWELGVNFWPHEDVVLKADWRSRDHDKSASSGRDFDGFDLGIGYHF